MKPVSYRNVETWSVEFKNDFTGEIYYGEYIDLRLDKDTIPKDKFAYNCRHDDDGNWVDPVTIEKGGVLVNFAGVFITDKEIKFPDGKNYICVTLIE